MEYEVTPEPGADEREALERALAELLPEEQHPAYASEWRRAGIAESVSGHGARSE